MRFSTRTRYGLKAVLILAARYGEGSLAVSQIAKKEGLSVAYLEQILNALKRKGLVKSVRGPQGGYILAKKPGDITLKELLYTLADDATLNKKDVSSPVSVQGAEPDDAALANVLFWKRYKDAVDTNLSQATIKSLIDQARTLKKSKRSPGADFQFQI